MKQSYDHPRELGYGFGKCEICDKNRRNPYSFHRRLFILICKLRPLLAASSYVLVFPSLPPSWEKRVVFSHLNYIFSCIHQLDAVYAKNEASRIEIMACTMQSVTKVLA